MHVILRAVWFREFSVFVKNALFDQDGESAFGCRGTLFAQTLRGCDEFGKVLVAHQRLRPF